MPLADPRHRGGNQVRLLGEYVRAQHRVALAGGQRAVEIVLAVRDALDRAALGQPQPSANAVARSERVELRREQIRHPPALARQLEVAGQVEQPLAPILRPWRRQAQRMLGQDDRLLRGTACGRPGSSGRSRRRQAVIRTRRREREVEGAQLLIGEHACELQMELAAFPGSRLGHRRCSQERVRRANTVPLDDHHPGLDSVVERARVRERRQLRLPQAGLQREGEQQRAHRARPLGHARSEHVLDLVRDRQVAPDRRRPTGGQCAPHLEGEQRVTQRGLEHPAQHVPRQAQPEPLGQDPPRCSDAQVPHLEAFQRPPLERALEGRRGAGTPGEQERDRLARETAGSEGERIARRTIEPLDVVDGDQERFAGSQGAQRVQEADGDRVRLRRSARRLGAEKGHLEGMKLRKRHSRELLPTDAVQQVDQRRGREPRLGAAPPCREHPQPTHPSQVDLQPPRASSCRSPARL